MTEPASHVLVLDDDELVGATIGMIVEDAGYPVQVTSRFEAFWDALRTSDASHVVLDLDMPGTDGIEVLRRLADHGYAGSVILSSGLERRVLEAARQSAVEHGLRLAGTLPKPFEARALHALLAVHAGATSGGATEAQVRGRPDVAALRASLESRQIGVAYQPKIACAGGAVLGFEALARWHHPTLGVVPPDVFVPLAEREGLIDALSDHVFGTALAWLARTDPNGTTHVALNLSARSLTDATIVDRLERLCATHRIALARVVLELTETATPDDEVEALAILTRLRIKGVGLAIDDFGTGHSTLTQLARQPFSELKIDRRFVMNAATSRESRTIVRATVSLAHGLGLRVTAEGVEDAEVFAYLTELGCDAAQGYHLAPPMYEEDLHAWLERRDTDAPNVDA
ncbi:MAG: EAL domain-containing response regulator [Trueperaceae bacterium]|nr:EAL domain-containing response regulator [Trueperaceae bacterium]